MSQQDPTAGYRKYPRGPNFFGIVVGASVILVLLLIAAYFLLHHDARKMIPHGPGPTPNSLLQPLTPNSATANTIRNA